MNSENLPEMGLNLNLTAQLMRNAASEELLLK